MLDQEIGTRLKELRVEFRVKAQAVADRANMGSSAISKVENGKQRPSERLLLAYAELFDISVERLQDLIAPLPKFPLFSETVAFLSSELWEHSEDAIAASGDSVVDTAVNERQLAVLLERFVRSGAQSPRDLTMWFHSPPYVARGLRTTGHLLDAFRYAIWQGCRILYVASDQEIHRLDTTHFKMKILLSLFSRQYEVEHGLPDDERVRTRTVAPLSTTAMERTATYGTKAAAPRFRSISPVTPCDIAYWNNHSMFVAMPSTSATHAEVGVVLPVSSDDRFAEPFKLNTHFLDAQGTDTRVFTRSTEREFWDLWARLERDAGNQRLVQRFFSSMTRSAHFYHESGNDDWFRLLVNRIVGHNLTNDPERRSAAEAYAQQIVKARRERAIAFQNRLASFSFRQVCDGEAIGQWLKTGRRPDAAFGESERKPDTKEERVTRLSGLLELMDRNRNFHLAITDRFDDNWRVRQAPGTKGTEISWIINENDIFAIERQEYDRPEFGETRIVMEQPEICRAFIDHFDSRWQSLRRDERERSLVMERIRGWLSQLSVLDA